MRAKEFIIEKLVDSSWVREITYTRAKKILTMRVKSGRVYSIHGITRSTFEKWFKSPSIGKYWHQFIKGNYRVTRIM